MTSSQIIKSAGFKTIRIEKPNFKGVFGGTCNHVIGLQNKNGDVLHFEGNPYFPCGKSTAFAALITSGDIKSNCFTFCKL